LQRQLAILAGENGYKDAILSTMNKQLELGKEELEIVEQTLAAARQKLKEMEECFLELVTKTRELENKISWIESHSYHAS
jgi:ribosomal protein L16 Arg81 hydroxylase